MLGILGKVFLSWKKFDAQFQRLKHTCGEMRKEKKAIQLLVPGSLQATGRDVMAGKHATIVRPAM